jgi:elongation factor G
VTPSDKLTIKNVGLFGHGGSGKTTLSEALLFATGVTKRMGDVEQGTTVMDFDDDEVNRSISINSAMAPVHWKETKITLVDTPGYADFIGDATSGIRVVDNCCFVVSGVDGVEVQTEIMWEKASVFDTPSFVFISKLDRERSSFERVMEEVQQALGRNAVPLNLPIGEEHDLRGIVDLLSGVGLEPDGPEKSREVEIPPELDNKISKWRDKLVEAVAETDDSLLEKYLDDGELTPAEIRGALRVSVRQRTLIPVLCGSASRGVGIPELLDFLADVIPASEDMPDITGIVSGTGEAVSFQRKPDAPLSALVFKTLADPYVGKLTYFRVFSGTLKSDSSAYNTKAGKNERISQLFKVTGKEQEPVGQLMAGELGAVAKLSDTGTGDTLCNKDNPLLLPAIEYPAPLMSLAVEPKTKGDEDKLSTALGRLSEEDPMLEVRRDTEVKQTLISGAGETHLDVVVEKMKRKFGVEVQTELPRIPYKETIRRKVESEGKHKKQTGGHGQYGHCHLRLEPLGRGDGYEFSDKIVGGVIPRNYIPGVEKGVVAAMEDGFVAGFPMTDMKVTVYDGSYHSVDSSELAFKMAAIKAMREGYQAADPVLLEPIMNVQVTVPEQLTGDVVGDLNSKRGRILGMEPKGKLQSVNAQVPLAEMSRYSIDLRSITGGRGIYAMDFSHYEEVPDHVAKRIEAERERQEEED